MRTIALLTLLISACDQPGISETDTNTPDPDSGTDLGTDTTPAEDCVATVVSTDPLDGSTAFPASLPLSATFSAVVSGGDISLGIPGVTGVTRLNNDGMGATFTPDAPLAGSTDYSFTAGVCTDSVTVGFRTAGAPVDASGLTDRTYAIDFNDVQWLAPAGADLLTNQIPVEYILVHVTEANATAETIDSSVAIGMTDTASGAVIQDPCQAPYDLGVQPFTTNPVFRVGPSTLTFDVQGSLAAVSDAFVEAVFVEQGDAIENVTISGQIDTRPLDQFAILSGDLCTDLGILSVTCVACDTDGAVECLDTVLAVDRANAVDGLVYDPALVPACR